MRGQHEHRTGYKTGYEMTACFRIHSSHRDCQPHFLFAQASGQGAQDLYPRFRPSASVAGHRQRARIADPPQAGGASWEGYAIEEALAALQPDEAYFWVTHQGAEIDLVLRVGGRLLGIECKRTDTPRMTPSMRMALDELGLERIAVVYPGPKRFDIAPRVEAVPLHALWHKPLFPP